MEGKNVLLRKMKSKSNVWKDFYQFITNAHPLKLPCASNFLQNKIQSSWLQVIPNSLAKEITNMENPGILYLTE